MINEQPVTGRRIIVSALCASAIAFGAFKKGPDQALRIGLPEAHGEKIPASEQAKRVNHWLSGIKSKDAKSREDSLHMAGYVLEYDVPDPKAVPGLAKSLPALFNIMNADPEVKVRAEAAVVIGRIGDMGAFPELLEAAKKDANLPIVNKILFAIECIAQKNPGNPELEKAVPFLLEKLPRALKDGKSPYCDFCLIDALAAIGGPRATDQLIKVAFMRRAPIEVRRAAIADLGDALAESRTSDRRIVPAILSGLSDMRPFWCEGTCWLPQTVAIVLGEIKDPRAVIPLTKALGNVEEDVRLSVIEALASIGDRRALPALARAGTGGTYKTREYAREAIKAIRDKREMWKKDQSQAQ